MPEPIPGSTLLYSWDHVHAAMCIWEEMVGHPINEPWDVMREWCGATQMRDHVITILAPAADAAWTAAHEREPDCDHGSYDWDFIPMWLRHCVDWSGEAPVVRATSTMPNETA